MLALSYITCVSIGQHDSRSDYNQSCAAGLSENLRNELLEAYNTP